MSADQTQVVLNGDVIRNFLSGLAIVVSLIAIVVTVTNNRLSRRQSLTTILAELAKVQIAALELQRDDKHQTEIGMGLRRVYNLQRRFYSQLATRLIGKLPKKHVTDIDYNLLATASNDSTNPVLAEQHWLAAIENSAENPPYLAMNRRALARFYFVQGRLQNGREHFQYSLDVRLRDDFDGLIRLRADTYWLWARQEIDAGCPAEAEHLIKEARSEAGKIKNARIRREQLGFIDLLTPMIKEPTATNQDDPSPPSTGSA